LIGESVITNKRDDLDMLNALKWFMWSLVSGLQSYVSGLMVFLLMTMACEASDPADEPMFSRAKILRLVNQARREGRYCGSEWYGPVKDLRWNDKLEEAARIHSDDMYQNGFLSHTGSDGKKVDDRLYSVHYFWTACGENVAYGALYEDE